jgi:hypothetical protein
MPVRFALRISDVEAAASPAIFQKSELRAENAGVAVAKPFDNQYNPLNFQNQPSARHIWDA